MWIMLRNPMPHLLRPVAGIDWSQLSSGLLIWYILLTRAVGSDYVTIVTEGQRYALSEGETVVLVCDFQAEYYNLFDYPVLWIKTQHEENTQVNIMSNLNPPFVETGRFEISFSPTPPRYRLELLITEVLPEDSGNYTCEVRGPESAVLAHVTHDVFVRAPVDAVYIMAENYSSSYQHTNKHSPQDDPDIHSTVDINIRHDGHKNSHKTASPSPRSLTLIEDTLNTIRCIAQGGYPAPHVELKVGRKDITDHFRLITRPSLSGEKGLRIITYTTELITDSFIPRDKDDGKRLRCFASVPGLTTNVSAVNLDVLYAPKIECKANAVYEMEKNPVLRCEVYAKPDLSALFWMIDANGTTLSEGEMVDEFWTIILEKRENYVETDLFMRMARPEYFRTYTLVAENSVAANSRNVDLIRRERTTSLQPLPHPTERSQSSYRQVHSDGPSLHFTFTTNWCHIYSPVALCAVCLILWTVVSSGS